ncbi:MAG TPA: GPP34 family phosphoprotein [Tissierellia bacterium]|nr:GPP34 family phosphoprotein [Tissierellia bacterium]
MNLSIPQSFLLLTVPEKGSFSVLSSYENWLIASAILELILSDVADLSDEKIMIVRDLPPELSYLSGLYQFLMIYEGSLKNAVLSFGMEDLGRKQRQVLTGTFESLSALGLVTPQPKRRLGVKHTAYIPDLTARDQLVEELRATILEGDFNTDMVALTMLLDKSGDLRHFFTDYERKRFRQQFERWQQDPRFRSVAQAIDFVLQLLLLYIIVTANA